MRRERSLPPGAMRQHGRSLPPCARCVRFNSTTRRDTEHETCRRGIASVTRWWTQWRGHSCPRPTRPPLLSGLRRGEQEWPRYRPVPSLVDGIRRAASAQTRGGVLAAWARRSGRGGASVQRRVASVRVTATTKRGPPNSSERRVHAIGGTRSVASAYVTATTERGPPNPPRQSSPAFTKESCGLTPPLSLRTHRPARSPDAGTRKRRCWTE